MLEQGRNLIIPMSQKNVRVSEASKRDFDFFLSTPLDLIGQTDADALHIDETAAPSGHSAQECWHLKDTHGRMSACREPEKLKKAVRGKKSWNLQIKMWAEDLGGDLPTLRQTELHAACTGLPSWIFDAAVRQAERIASARMGWAPRFARLEKLFGFWWPPEMDAFDAAI